MKIDISKKLHQDNLKAEIYHQFKVRFPESNIGIMCEYKHQKSRFDLLFFDKATEESILIVEVRRIGAKKPVDKNGKQFLKYSQYGCNLFHISDFSKIQELLDVLR